MPLPRTFDVVFTDQDFTTSIMAENDSLTVNDILTQNGLMPRDGTFRYVSSPAGTMINHMSVASAPSVIRVQNPKNVVQLWVERCSENTQRAQVSSEDQNYLLYGVERDIHANIFLTNRYYGSVKVGYSFSPLGQPYTTGKIVFLQVPVQGDRATLFNPLNGKEDYPLRLVGDLEPKRGFWSAWQIGANLNTAAFRADLTPLPAEFKPWRPKAKIREEAEPVPTQKDPRARRIKMKALNRISAEPSIYSCQVWKNNPARSTSAIVCGAEMQSSSSGTGFVAAWGNKTRPTMINRAGYQFGMSAFIKIPEEGRVVALYNSIQNVYVNCRLTDSENLRVEDLRGRWVIAQLRRHTKHKRVLKLHSMPSDVEAPVS